MVVNGLTESVATMAAGRNTNYPPWPGQSFTTDTENGLALLGCPNGWGVGYMLTQHSATSLGRKTVDRVAVFGDPVGGFTVRLNLGFHIAGWTPPSVGL